MMKSKKEVTVQQTSESNGMDSNGVSKEVVKSIIDSFDVEIKRLMEDGTLEELSIANSNLVLMANTISQYQKNIQTAWLKQSWLEQDYHVDAEGRVHFEKPVIEVNNSIGLILD